MENSSLEEENIIKDIRNFFTLKIETKSIKDQILRDIKNLLSMKKKKIIINE